MHVAMTTTTTTEDTGHTGRTTTRAATGKQEDDGMHGQDVDSLSLGSVIPMSQDNNNSNNSNNNNSNCPLTLPLLPLLQ